MLGGGLIRDNLEGKQGHEHSPEWLGARESVASRRAEDVEDGDDESDVAAETVRRVSESESDAYCSRSAAYSRSSPRIAEIRLGLEISASITRVIDSFPSREEYIAAVSLHSSRTDLLLGLARRPLFLWARYHHHPSSLQVTANYHDFGRPALHRRQRG